MTVNRENKHAQTNRSFLSALSDEELAHWLTEHLTDSPWCKPDAPIYPETMKCKLWDCEKCALEWLKQEETTNNV